MSAEVEASLPAFFAVPALPPAAAVTAAGAAGGSGVDVALPLVAASDCALFFLRAMSPNAW